MGGEPAETWERQQINESVASRDDICNRVNAAVKALKGETDMSLSGRIQEALDFLTFVKEPPLPTLARVSGGQAVEDWWRKVAIGAHGNSISKGWWSGGSDAKNAGEQIALIQSEVAEAYAAIWGGVARKPSSKIPFHSNLEEELADVVIRIMDTAMGKNWDVGTALRTLLDCSESYANCLGPRVGKLTGTGDYLALINFACSQALEGLREHDTPHPYIPGSRRCEGWLAFATLMCAKTFHEEAGLPDQMKRLSLAVEAKAEYNKTRQIKHGGKSF